MLLTQPLKLLTVPNPGGNDIARSAIVTIDIKIFTVIIIGTKLRYTTLLPAVEHAARLGGAGLDLLIRPGSCQLDLLKD